MAKSIARHINNSNKLNLWTPSYISTQSWWDASRVTTITESGGGYISQLDDLSGNGNHMIQATGALQVLTGVKNINGLNCIYNNDSGSSKPYMYANMTCPNDHMLFIVMNMDDSQFSQGPFSWAGTDAYGGYRYMDELKGSGNGGSDIVLGTNYAQDVDVLFGLTFDGSGNGLKEVFKNGTSSGIANYTSISASSGAQDFRLFKNADQSCQAWIGECLIVPTDISNETRHKIEGYLAHKWGLQANLPNNHPYFSFPPRINDDVIIDLWNPSLMTTTSAWYDASDSSTITEIAGSVSQWNDKSGNANHAVQATGSNQPTTNSETIGGLNAIRFDQSSFEYFTASNSSSLNFDGNTGFGMFAVLHPLGYNNIGSGVNSFFSKGIALTSSQSYSLRTTSGDTIQSHNGVDINPSDDVSITNTDVLVSSDYVKSTTTGSIFINGILENTDNVGTGLSDNSSSLYIGRDNNSEPNRCANFRLGEMILVPNVISDDTRQRIEGYLAWKWSLVDNLPDNHPYKFEPPRAYVDWTPTNIDTVGWYDASDLSTITEAGGVVSQWNDKSGYDNHAIQGTGAKQPNLISDAINGLDVIEFVERNDYLDAIGNFVNFEWVAVVLQYNASPNFSQALGSQTLGSGGGYLVQYRGDVDPDRWNSVYFTNGNSESFFGASVNVNPTIVVFDGLNRTNFDLQIGGDRGISNRGWDGYIAEVICGGSVLDVAIRERVEGYLAWKWGIVSVLSSSHPYRSAPPKEQWTPSEISTDAWYDSSDISTITEVGGAISQWDDKSGSSNHLIQSVTAQKPSYTSNKVTFGLNNNMDFTTPLPSNYYMFVVGAPRVNTAYRTLLYTSVGNQPYVVNNGVDQVGHISTTFAGASGITWTEAERALMGFVSNANSYQKNGGGLSFIFSGLPDTQATALGGNAGTDSEGFGEVNEVVMISVPASIATVQKIEGYLAWKWGLTANLPSGHPYKNKPPTKRD